MMRMILLGSFFSLISIVNAQEWKGKFEQLGSLWPTPNTYRTASGAPGQDYWQQKVDYKITIELDDERQSIIGQEGITYQNNSPHELPYLWLQLEQNIREKEGDRRLTKTGGMSKGMTPEEFIALNADDDYKGGMNIDWVRSGLGTDLKYSIYKTMMRVDLPKPLAPGQSVVLWIAWNYDINNRLTEGGRSGYEYFPKDKNYLYTIGQFYPRMAVYSDYGGWNNKQYLGKGEFALNFGDYEVEIVAPEHMVIAATGKLANPNEVLSKDQIERFDKAKTTYDRPLFIITEGDAKRNEPLRSKKKKHWHFDAENVRDFAFAASRKFVWDAMAVKVGNSEVMAMSFYPKEASNLWKQYATKVNAHTLRFYSDYLFEYPYPVAISVHTADLGMEYPMINFSYGRPEKTNEFTESEKNSMIGVLIHEVGHNFFPMIVNSDEKNWFWMDEGINSYLQYLAEQKWMWGFPSRRGPSEKGMKYMKGDFRPIMVNPEQIISINGNAYSRPATALNILRNVVMGPELFDYGMKTYANRWKFKHPIPSDFFRTMEDASAVDLDWFWKGWFFSTDHVDVSIESIKWYKLNNGRSQSMETTSTINSTPFSFSFQSPKYGEFRQILDEEKFREKMESKNYYEVTFKNLGGLVTPLILEWTYSDTSKEVEKIPAEVWRMNENEITKVFVKEKEVVSLKFDPDKITADTDEKNNIFPRAQKD